MDSSILVGDCLEVLKTLPAESVQTCVTSPPYWGLRDYGIPPRNWSDGSVCAFGNEPTPELYVQHSVEIFREVRRVLRTDGTLWLNLGDSYNQDAKWGGASSGKNDPKQGYARKTSRSRDSGSKPGDLCNVPHRVASALQADGWFWRSTIIWAKRSPVPESITGWRWVRCRVKVASNQPRGQAYSGVGETFRSHSGGVATLGGAKWAPCPGCKKCEPTGGYRLRRGKWRPTCGHEYVFLLSKSERYFCDGDAVQEATTGGAHSRGSGLNPKAIGGIVGTEKQNGSFSASVKSVLATRNPRSVWTLSTEPFKGAHFATYPTSLPKKAIEAATSSVGCCPECGTCWSPVVQSERIATRPGIENKIWKHSGADALTKRSATSPNLNPKRHISVGSILGYRPSCNCNAGAPVPCVVLDPFGGSGTTGQVANALGRRYVLIEVNPDYVELIRKRVETPLRAAKAAKKRHRSSALQLSLFDQ